MNTYHITRLPAGTACGDIPWNTIPAAPIDTYLWLTGYAPRAEAKLVYIEGEGFILRMTCEETAPRVVYENYNEPVYTDSCLEFFAIWDNASEEYINMEMNARGTLLSCIAPGRHDRTPVKDVCGRIFDVQGEIGEHAWTVTAYIPLSMLAELYHTDAATLTAKMTPGYTFRGNFYKCGDETAIPHYGMWNPVGTETPDFHAPAYFGELVMD